jgi:hypothetical protein
VPLKITKVTPDIFGQRSAGSRQIVPLKPLVDVALLRQDFEGLRNANVGYVDTCATAPKLVIDLSPPFATPLNPFALTAVGRAAQRYVLVGQEACVYEVVVTSTVGSSENLTVPRHSMPAISGSFQPSKAETATGTPGRVVQ